MYHPTLSRWLSRDPLGYIDGPNLYGYCGNRPGGATDPMGMEAYSPIPMVTDGRHYHIPGTAKLPVPASATEPSRSGDTGWYIYALPEPSLWQRGMSVYKLSMGLNPMVASNMGAYETLRATHVRAKWYRKELHMDGVKIVGAYGRALADKLVDVVNPMGAADFRRATSLMVLDDSGSEVAFYTPTEKQRTWFWIKGWGKFGLDSLLMGLSAYARSSAIDAKAATIHNQAHNAANYVRLKKRLFVEQEISQGRFAWQQYEALHGAQPTALHTSLRGTDATVVLDKPPTGDTVFELKHYNWWKPAYDKPFIQESVARNLRLQITKYQTVRPDVHIQFSQPPPPWVVRVLEEMGATWSVKAYP
jgi:hypothetical protein